MNKNDFFMQSFIPLLLTVGLAYNGLRMLITKDASIILGKDKKPLKDEGMYVKWAGGLLLFLSVGSAAMLGLGYFSAKAGFTVLLVFLVIFMALWVRMTKKYGDK